MKSMTYAQKADLVDKCRRVFESVRRSNQVAMAYKYRALAVKAIGDYELCSDAQGAFDAMERRISTKPRYRYDNRAGEWVKSSDYKKRERRRVDNEISKLRHDAWAAEQQLRVMAMRPSDTLANAYGYAEQQRREGLGCFPAHRLGAGVNPLTGW